MLPSLPRFRFPAGLFLAFKCEGRRPAKPWLLLLGAKVLSERATLLFWENAGWGWTTAAGDTSPAAVAPGEVRWWITRLRHLNCVDNGSSSHPPFLRHGPLHM